MSKKETLFNQLYPEIKRLVERRQATWRLTTVAWEDVSAVIIERIWQKFDLYDPEKPLDRWVNTVASHAISNLLRQNLYKNSPPCEAGTAYGAKCSFNLGCGRCKWTETHGSLSGLQDISCPFYAKWVKKKQTKFAISTPLSIENHTDEYNTKPGDIVDEEWIEDKKKLMDVRILARLNREEARIYRLLFIKHLEEEEVGKKMGYKKQANSNVCGYSQIRAIKIRIREVAEQIISEEGII